MANGSILVVDDETKILNALADALRDEGHEVVATPSAPEARKLLSQRMFDLLVVDNLMPELTGLDLIRELSALPAPERPVGRGSTSSSASSPLPWVPAPRWRSSSRPAMPSGPAAGLSSSASRRSGGSPSRRSRRAWGPASSR